MVVAHLPLSEVVQDRHTVVQIQPRKHVLDDADSMAMAPSRQHELVTAVDNTRSGTDLA